LTLPPPADDEVDGDADVPNELTLVRSPLRCCSSNELAVVTAAAADVGVDVDVVTLLLICF
jgi:hypothetical protein